MENGPTENNEIENDTTIEFQDFLRSRHVDPKDIGVVFDIGSRDGLQSVELASVFANARVFAVECNPNTLDRLRANIAKSPNVTLIPKAVNEFTGRCKFFPTNAERTVTPWPDGNPGASSLFIARGDYPLETYVQDTVEVECARLDDLCAENNLDAIDLIWMDLQGAELIAFQSAGAILDRVKYIYVEVSFKPLYHGQCMFDDVDVYLQSRGFRLCSPINRHLWQQNVIYENMRYNPRAIEPDPELLREYGGAVVLSQPWGGLGDNLQLSTLPERFAALGIPVYISEQNAVRNQEIYDLVWGCNPHVSGVSPAPQNAGASRLGAFRALSPFTNFIERWETSHGLDPLNQFPKIYYTPKPRPDVKDIILVDLGSTSVGLPQEHLLQYIGHILNQFHYPIEQFRHVSFAKFASANNVRFREFGDIVVNDIYEYCDILSSCAAFVTVHSGAMSLAAALRQNRERPVIHSFSTQSQFNTRIFIYKNVEYFVMG